MSSLRALHFALSTGAYYVMPPPAKSSNNVLARTIRNIEQAQGRVRHHATAVDILQAPTDNEAVLASLPSTAMDDLASPDVAADATKTAPTSEDVPTPINLTLDLAASTTLLQSLRTRNTILVNDIARATHSLGCHEDKSGRALSRERRSKVKWMVVATCSLAVWLVYLWWCWYMREEFEYIRKRRGEVFGG